ncbi:hypothetical protein NitYY0826_C0863 [Nitratiruptor sp. YY08-26]|uniref:hypothetical protein n=1 Tax=unclassified Nitratiruptor TaxID=2624044 RepID=UPI001915F599|nr:MULTISPECIES: hypothetical protein [unclassified Nitratiruptor]BCD61995.1 hypothetical protein NitYY0813_C0861 [Nitratiruptor sp. YY08-13]BCD65931.1 hypothetical protein NitYY0826_C0863 [Nitratiruptor sp. YY08-26]
MIHNILTSLTLFFSSLIYPVDDTAAIAKPQVYQMQTQKSFFEYSDQRTIQGVLYFEKHTGIKTDNVEKKYFFENVEIEAQNCIVKDFTPQSPIDITDKNNITFTINFANDCLTNYITFKADLVQQNKISLNGKVYSAKKKSQFGPLVVPNKERISVTSYNILLQPADNNKEMVTDAIKQIKYKIVDAQGNQVASKNLKSLYIRSLDGEKLKIKQNNEYVDDLLLENNISSYGEIEVKSFSKPGDISINFNVSLQVGKIVLTKEASLTLHIKELPDLYYTAKLQTEKNYFVKGNNGYINYSIVSKTYNKLIDPQKIERIIVSSKSASIKLFSPTGEKVDSFILTGRDIKNSGLIIVSGEEEGLAKLEFKVEFKPDSLQKEIVISKTYPVLHKAPINFALEYVGTEYNETSGFFEDAYTIKVDSDNLEGKNVKIVAITPKLLYPEVYYDKFIKGELDNINNPYFHNIFYRDIYSENGAKIIKNGGTIFSILAEPINIRPNLSEVDPIQDKLIILPNKYRNATSYLGAWSIQSVIDSSTLLLGEEADGEIDSLGYVIGDPTRYNPSQDTIAAIMLNKQDGQYPVKNGLVQFKLAYPTFFAGKDIFFSVVYGEGKERIGNSYKRTLTGTALTARQPSDCVDRVCAERVKIFFKDNNKPLQYARFGAVCKEAFTDRGKGWDYLYFTDLENGCVQNPYYGFKINQKTDGNGEVLMCIYPKLNYVEKTDPDTNQTYQVAEGYRRTQPECEYQVAEEFPY